MVVLIKKMRKLSRWLAQHTWFRVLKSNLYFDLWDGKHSVSHVPVLLRWKLLIFIIIWFYRAFSLTWPAVMQIYWNKRKCLHKKRVQLPQDWFGTPTWPPFYCLGTKIWLPWRHVKTPYYFYLVLIFFKISIRFLLFWLLVKVPGVPRRFRAGSGGFRQVPGRFCVLHTPLKTLNFPLYTVLLFMW